MSERFCPVPGCGAPAKNGHLMCRSCWFTVPAFIRAAVNHAWKKYRKGGFDAAGKRRAYEAAVKRAVEAAEERR